MARAFAEPLLKGRTLDSGEEAWSHAVGVAQILKALGAGPGMQAAAFLVYVGDFLQRPCETVAQAFGESYAGLVELTRKLVQVQRAAREAQVDVQGRERQTERVRKMLLAFSKDLRVVLLRLASRLQTLRWHSSSKTPCDSALALESQQVFAPLANRLGIWQIKWEMEDLSFRFLDPQSYFQIAELLDERRQSRELAVEFVRHQVAGVLRQASLDSTVQGRPKHIYSIWRKMQGKSLPFEKVLDIRALRVVVAAVPDCYAALSALHQRYRPLAGEFDDYIARPKPNGYQSLHTVVLGDDGRPVEVQIRTQAMHDHAEHGVAAHWAYKEAGAKGYAGVSASADAAERMTEARKQVMRQLLAWERDFAAPTPNPATHPADARGEPLDGERKAPLQSPSQGGSDEAPAPAAEDRIYVLTPQYTVVELSSGATAVDFAYALHTDLGHRCRGARVDGTLVPLNTPLVNGQTVEVLSAREGGPSLDWLNHELGYLQSPRARAKVRAWFNAQALRHTIAKGRELVERLLQREGKTSLRLDDLAERLGFKEASALFEVVGKDEYSLKQIEALLRPAPEQPVGQDDTVAIRRSRAGRSGVLVVGVESLMTTLSRCCRPAPPDAIGGFVTRGKGVAVHRTDCSNFRHMSSSSTDRVIPVDWGAAEGLAAGAERGVRGAPSGHAPLYPLDVVIEAADRQGLLRDISEVLTRERVNVTGVNTRSVKDSTGGTAWMTFTVEVSDTRRLQQVLRQVAEVSGVRSARRR
ncbi:MAG: bifunctional (p)ppGpp synthetase/guanosine-3',5'-bis(diphosphate) 3'-pyrophosphohydrolase [Betaproteobacteria bacterium]